jgi:hypothetical protein
MCFCSNSTYGKYGRSIICNVPCVGNSGQTCGGILANSIYKTALSKIKMLKYSIKSDWKISFFTLQ